MPQSREAAAGYVTHNLGGEPADVVIGGLIRLSSIVRSLPVLKEIITAVQSTTRIPKVIRGDIRRLVFNKRNLSDSEIVVSMLSIIIWPTTLMPYHNWSYNRDNARNKNNIPWTIMKNLRARETGISS